MSSSSDSMIGRDGLPQRTSSDKKKILLRIDHDLHRGLKLWANDEFRSLNAHIEFLLKNVLSDHRRD